MFGTGRTWQWWGGASVSQVCFEASTLDTVSQCYGGAMGSGQTKKDTVRPQHNSTKTLSKMKSYNSAIKRLKTPLADKLSQ